MCSAASSRWRRARAWPHFIAERITGPLGMVDTGFAATGDARRARRRAADRRGHRQAPADAQSVAAGRAGHSGGGGAVSTAADYLRFCQMLLNGGELDGVRLLAPKIDRAHGLRPSAARLRLRRDDALALRRARAGAGDGLRLRPRLLRAQGARACRRCRARSANSSGAASPAPISGSTRRSRWSSS